MSRKQPTKAHLYRALDLALEGHHLSCPYVEGTKGRCVHGLSHERAFVCSQEASYEKANECWAFGYIRQAMREADAMKGGG